VTAAVQALHDVGYDRLSMRDVSRRAGITHATTYGYFSSKQHVIAEAFARLVDQWGGQHIVGDLPADRLKQVFTSFGALLADDPDLSRSSTAALLSDDQSVRRVRERVGHTIADQLAAALGDHATEDRLDALTIAINGATLQAGLGHARYTEFAERFMRAARFVIADIEN